MGLKCFTEKVKAKKKQSPPKGDEQERKIYSRGYQNIVIECAISEGMNKLSRGVQLNAQKQTHTNMKMLCNRVRISNECGKVETIVQRQKKNVDLEKAEVGSLSHTIFKTKQNFR